MGTNDKGFENLPPVAAEYIKDIIKKMRYRKKVRSDVMAELVAHFEDALQQCETPEEKQKTAEELIERFGDAKLLGKLIRRGKKRCRPLWRKIVAKGFQAIGVLFLLLIIHIA